MKIFEEQWKCTYGQKNYFEEYEKIDRMNHEMTAINNPESDISGTISFKRAIFVIHYKI